ncbi:MAG: orotate phosphoribosyltransferase [Dehalococcoidia bacterium]
MDRQGLETLRDLMQRRCFQYGDFTLASGRKSKFYYNGKLVTLRPSGAKLIGEALVDVVLASGAEAVGGPALGAVPIAMAVGAAGVALGRDLPVFVVRMEQKEHGARDLIAEPYSDAERPVVAEGRRLAIVEDTITTGGSVRKAIDAVESLGCEVVLVAVLVERHEGGADELRKQGYDVVSLFRADEEGRLTVNEAYVERLEAAQGGR